MFTYFEVSWPWFVGKLFYLHQTPPHPLFFVQTGPFCCDCTFLPLHPFSCGVSYCLTNKNSNNTYPGLNYESDTLLSTFG